MNKNPHQPRLCSWTSRLGLYGLNAHIVSFYSTPLSLRSFALAVRQGLNPDHPLSHLPKVREKRWWSGFALTNGFHPKIYHRPRGRLPLIAVRLWPRFRLPHASPQGLRCGLSERRPPLRGLHCPSGSFQQPKIKHWDNFLKGLVVW